MVGSVNNLTTPALARWIKLYNLTFLVGIAISFTAMVGICYIFPPEGLGVDEPFVEVDGLGREGGDEEKGEGVVMMVEGR